MTPKPNSMPDKAIAYIRQQGTARARQIADAIGSNTNSILTMLAPYVSSGDLICCKVTTFGTPPQNEYRIGSGIRPLTQTPELGTSKPQPTVGKNIGRVSSGTLLPDRASPEGHAVAPAPRPDVSPLATQPGRAGARDENDFALSIDDDGRLSITRHTAPADPLRFSAAETMALGDFLHATEGLWRS